MSPRIINRCAKEALIERYMEVRAEMIAQYTKPMAGSSRDFLDRMIALDGTPNLEDGGETSVVVRMCDLCKVVAILSATGEITCAEGCTSIYSEIRRSSKVIWVAAKNWDNASGVAS